MKHAMRLPMTEQDLPAPGRTAAPAAPWAPVG